MPITLLPASAAAFAPRTAPNIVLNKKAEPWLTATLKRINRVKRPLNSVSQHHRCLTETLSAPTAIWTLCSLMLPKLPDSELKKDENPLVEALSNYQFLHVEAYVVHVDMVSQNEVAFKLTTETIDALVEYHKDVFSVDESASTYNWSEKEVQLKKLQEDFVQSVNKYVFRTAATALEGLEEDGAGELLSGGADEVKTAVMGMFLPLMPPPPRHVDVIRPAPILPSSTGTETWWPSQITSAPQDTWKVLPSSPSPGTPSSVSSSSATWANLTIDELQTPSPVSPYSPVFEQALSTSAYIEPLYHSCTSAYTPSLLSYQLPSVIASQCSTASIPGAYCGLDAYADLGYLDYGVPFSMPIPFVATAM